MTFLWLLTASFQSPARGRREEDAISKPSSVTWRVISSPVLITCGSWKCSEIHQKKSHGALIFLYLGEHHLTLSLHVLLTDFTLPWITGLLIPAYRALQARQAVSDTAQVPVQGACFHSNYTFHNWLVKHFEDMTLSVANTKWYCWTGLTWAIK